MQFFIHQNSQHSSPSLYSCLGCADPCTGPCTWPCWIFSSQDCIGLSGWYLNPQMCQQHVSLLLCAYASCPLVWSAVPYSAKLSSCLPFQISYTWWTRALLLCGKICKLKPALFSLKTVSHRVLLTNSFEELKYCFFKIQGTFFFTWPITLRTANSISEQSLQPRLLSVLIPPMSSLALMTIRSSNSHLW